MPTVLGELGGGELRGDEEGLFCAALEDEAGGDAGAAVVVLSAAGQAQVQGVVVKRAVLITLRAEQRTQALPEPYPVYKSGPRGFLADVCALSRNPQHG